MALDPQLVQDLLRTARQRGASAGDALLGQVGALLKSKVRWRDTLSRLGGDEFGILLESCSLDEAMRTVTR